MTFLIRLSLIFLILSYLLISSVALQQDAPKPLRKRDPFCDDGKYGRPTFDDCLQAWFFLPYYDDVPRQFVSVHVDAPISQVRAPIQLPLIRGFRSCRIAVANPALASGIPAEDMGTWTEVRIAAQEVLQSCVAATGRGGSDQMGRNRLILIFVYETGSLFDHDYPSYPQAVPLLEVNPSSGQASTGNVAAASQDQEQTPAEWNTAPGHFSGHFSADYALQCAAMYCAKGGLCCRGYTCSSGSTAFAKVLNFILLGVQESLSGIASSCVPS